MNVVTGKLSRWDKQHKINVAYDLISRVADDTDENLWAWEDLHQALVSLEEWFEEEDIQTLIKIMLSRRVRKAYATAILNLKIFENFDIINYKIRKENLYVSELGK